MSASRPAGYVPLGLAVVCVSVGSILIRLAQAPALATAFFRVGLAAAILAPFAAGSLYRSWAGLPRNQRLIVFGCGLALALHFATWIASLSYTTVAASVLFVNLAPIFNVLFSRVFLGERTTPLVLASLGLALPGAGMIAADDWTGGGAAPLRGDVLALVGAVALSAYHVIGRGLREALPLSAYVLGVWSAAAVALGALAAAASTPLLGLPARSYAFLLALALIPTLAGHGLVNRSLRLLPAPVVGLFLLGEPIIASLLAYALFHERPGAWTLAGGGVVIAALALLVLGSRR